MTIDDALITYLEDLSRLSLNEAEKSDAKENLAKILTYVDKLAELDTEGVEALSHPFPAVNNFRADEVRPSLEREKILAAAPKQKDGCFQVPKTVE